jgi:hypothetical protein
VVKQKETGKRAFERRRRPRADAVAALAMSREQQDLSSEGDLSRESARLHKTGYVCLARLAEEYAESGPPMSHQTRLKRAQRLLIAQLHGEAFPGDGLLLDSRATGPRPLTSLLFTMLVRTALDQKQESVRLLEGCWVKGKAARRWVKEHLETELRSI